LLPWLGGLCVVVNLLPADAQPAPATLRMQYVQGETLHIANQGGAINRHDEATVVIDLKPGYRLAVSDTGSRREHNLYKRFSTDEKRAWTTRWTGTWRLDRGDLVLELVRAAEQCASTKAMDRGPPEVLACRPSAARLQLRCRAEVVPLDDKSRRAVWRCPTDPGLGESLPWVVGRPGCVRMIGSRRGDSFTPCAP
jgi:hypothetical protein